MTRAKDEPYPLYDRDDFTNRFLERFPVHCELRTGELRRKRLHFHEGYELYLCLSGTGAFLVEDRLYPLHAGTLTLIGPNIVHHPFSEAGDKFSRYVLTIREDCLAA